MAEINHAWGRYITELMRRHELTTRSAEALVASLGGEVSNTYIHDMTKGKVPEYKKAYEFLEIFPREEAIECLGIAGIPIPAEWIEQPPSEVVEVGDARIEFRTTRDEFSPSEKEELRQAVEDILRKRQSRRVDKGVA